MRTNFRFVENGADMGHSTVAPKGWKRKFFEKIISGYEQPVVRSGCCLSSNHFALADGGRAKRTYRRQRTFFATREYLLPLMNADKR